METSPVAWYAAVLSSLVFVWDVAKWWRTEARLRIAAKAGVCFPDGELISEESRQDGTKVGTLASYCHVEIVNIGGRPTTLISVEAFARRKNPSKGEMFASSNNFKLHRGTEHLPAKLGPGDMWSARIDMRQLTALETFGPLRIRARGAGRDRPMEVAVRRSSAKQ
jgi:hypothetical protein